MGRDRDVTAVPQQQVAQMVEQLLAVNPYNPEILSELENYVNEQVSLPQLIYIYIYIRIVFSLNYCSYIYTYIYIGKKVNWVLISAIYIYI